MKSNRIPAIGFLLAMLFLFSCKKEKAPVVVYSVPVEFDLALCQALTPEGPPHIDITTVEKMPENDYLDVSLTQTPEGFELHIHDIVEDSIPSNNLNYIGTRMTLPVSGNGTYPLTLVIRETIRNEGALIVDDQKIRLEFSTNDGITSKSFSINRIPQDAFWGIAVVDSSDWALTHFEQELFDLSSPVDDWQVGSYGYFYLNGHGEVILDTLGLNLSQTTTFFRETNDFSPVDSLIQAYKAMAPDFQAAIITVDGQIFERTAPEWKAKKWMNNTFYLAP